METSPQMYDTGGSTSGSPEAVNKVQQPPQSKAKTLTTLGSGPSPTTTLTPHGPAAVPADGPANGPQQTPSQGGELAELTSSEISLDLQGLIDDSHFGDDNLFGDLIEAKKNELNHGYGLPTANRTSPAGSLGSSGQSSPGAPGQDSPPSVYPYRNALAYLPGSVHTGYHNNNNSGHPNHNVQVKQEPQEHVSTSYHRNNNGSNNSSNNNFVSSTTPTTGVPPNPHGGAGANNHYNQTPMGAVLPSLKSFAQVPKYLQPSPAAIKKKVRSAQTEPQ